MCVWGVPPGRWLAQDGESECKTRLWVLSWSSGGLSLSIKTFKLCLGFVPSLWAALVAQLVNNPPALREAWVRSLGWEDPLEKGKAAHSSVLAWRIPWTAEFMATKSRTRLSDFHFPGTSDHKGALSQAVFAAILLTPTHKRSPSYAYFGKVNVHDSRLFS